MLPSFYQIGANGPTLEIWPHKNTDIILFYPGTMLGPGHYKLFIRELWASGLAVASIHFSGHGKCHKKANFTFESLINEGRQAEQWLYEKGYKKVAVCGHSQGGIFALAHAACSSSLQASFPISAIFPQSEEAIQLTRFSRFSDYRKHILISLKYFSQFFPWLPIPLPFYLVLHKIIKGKRKPIYIGKEYGRFAYPLKYIYSLFIAHVSCKCYCPIYLINSKNDALFTPSLISSTFHKIMAPAKELLWLPDGGHMAIFNPYFSKFIADFIVSTCANLKMRFNCNRI